MTRKQRIEDTLSKNINAILVEIIDESHKHHVPEGHESHFNILIVSDEFEALSMIERHRTINKLLDMEFKSGLHALSLHLHTPIEWKSKQESRMSSPNCRDGYRHG